MSFGKSGYSDRRNTNSEDATKKVANFVESVNATGSSCYAREANTRGAFGPSLADFTSQVPPQNNEPVGAESGAVSENQTVMMTDRHTEGGSSKKQESEEYWAFKPTPAGEKLREELKEEEERKEREKNEESERKRKRTQGQNKALAAFMKTTDAKNQTNEWGERSLRGKQACPFCDRCAIIVVQDEFVFPSDNTLATLPQLSFV